MQRKERERERERETFKGERRRERVKGVMLLNKNRANQTLYKIC